VESSHLIIRDEGKGINEIMLRTSDWFIHNYSSIWFISVVYRVNAEPLGRIVYYCFKRSIWTKVK
jgi:hypothetical protein